jgi:hypothetical protein
MSVAKRLIEDEMAWGDLLEVEPVLDNLETLALYLHREEEDIHVWGLIKLALSLLVGDEARKPELRTSYSYDVAYERLQRCFEEGKIR